MERLNCPVCHSPLDSEATIECTACQTPHHKDCWDYIDGCAIFGCSQRNDNSAQEERANALDVPPEEYLFCNVSKIPYGVLALVLIFLVVLDAFFSALFQYIILFLLLGVTMRKKRALIGIHTRFDIKNGVIIEESRLGSYTLWKRSRPFSDISAMSIDLGMEDTGFVRCVTAVLKLTFKDGKSERLLFPEKDIETNSESDRRLSWARGIANSSGITFISPCFHNVDVAQKAIAVFPERVTHYEKDFLAQPFQFLWFYRFPISILSYSIFLLLSPTMFMIFSLTFIACLFFFKFIQRMHRSVQQDRPWRGVSIEEVMKGKVRGHELKEGHLETIAALNEQLNTMHKSGGNRLLRGLLYGLPIAIPLIGCLILISTSDPIVSGFTHAAIFISTLILLQLEYAHSSWLTQTRRIANGASKILDEVKSLPENTEDDEIQLLEEEPK